VVVGVPDPVQGQRVAAWVQLLPDATVSQTALAEFVRDRIAAYKAPEWIWIEPRLPATPLGKLDRHLLQRRAAERAPAGRLPSPG
jgi:acyl-CoA synthetase (AMP-forming)/AMP-acid ligase II